MLITLRKHTERNIQKNKISFIIISRGFMTPVHSWIVNSTLQSLLSNHFKGLTDIHLSIYSGFFVLFLALVLGRFGIGFCIFGCLLFVLVLYVVPYSKIIESRLFFAIETIIFCLINELSYLEYLKPQIELYLHTNVVGNGYFWRLRIGCCDWYSADFLGCLTFVPL